MQAKVDWPPDMPDDMLEDAISVAKKALDEHDFEVDGNKVSERDDPPTAVADCTNCEGTYGHQLGALLARFPR